MDTTDNERKTRRSGKEASQPIKVIRHGAIAASIWQRQSPAGFAYFDFSVSRSWKSLSSGRTGYSSNFFATHCSELSKVIAEASAWIVANTTDQANPGNQESVAA